MRGNETVIELTADKIPKADLLKDYLWADRRTKTSRTQAGDNKNFLTNFSVNFQTKKKTSCTIYKVSTFWSLNHCSLSAKNSFLTLTTSHSRAQNLTAKKIGFLEKKGEQTKKNWQNDSLSTCRVFNKAAQTWKDTAALKLEWNCLSVIPLRLKQWIK